MNFDKELQREAAKIGMTATLGVTVATSLFMKNKAAKKSSCSCRCCILWIYTLAYNVV